MPVEKQGIKVIKGRGIAYADNKGMYAKGSDRQIGFTLNRLGGIFKRNALGKASKQGHSAHTLFIPGTNITGGT